MDNVRGMTVLVTGANGFLGRHLIERLHPQGAKIYAVSRSVPAAADGIEWRQGDLTHLDWLQDLTTDIRPDVIFQMASCSLGGQDAQFVLPTFENDLRVTVNTLLAAKQCGCSRVVLVASLEEPVLDGRPVQIPSPYAAAKACCTYYGLMFHQLYGVPVTMLRPFMTYGPGQKPYKLIPHTLLSLLKREVPQLSSGERPVDWVYVDDVITAFLQAAVRPEAVGATIDLGSGTLVPVRDVVRQIHQFMPDAPGPLFGALPDRIMETVRCAETETAAKILNWRATTPLEEGLSKTVAWYRERMAAF
jgi:nucleoside-diphosphate-sugar epimerase